MASVTMGMELLRKFRPERVWRQREVPQSEVALAKYQVWSAEGDNRWRAILCLEGRVWITQKGDARDHAIEAGEMFLISRPGKVVVQALDRTRIQITSSLATASRDFACFQDRLR